MTNKVLLAGGLSLAMLAGACESTTPSPGDSTQTSTEVPSLRLAALPTPVVNAGASDEFAVLVERRDNATVAATITVSGAPAGVIVTPGPWSAAYKRATVTVTTDAAAPRGSFPLSVTASTPDGLVRTITVPLRVQDAPPVTPISFQWCAHASTTLAYQNDGGSWTTISPDASGVISFHATPKLVFATSLASYNAGSVSYFTTFLFITAEELQQSDCGQRKGSKTLHYRRLNTVAPGLTTISQLPDIADIVAVADVQPPGGPKYRAAIIRRGVNRPSGDTLPPFDFVSSEAAAIDSVAQPSVNSCNTYLHTGTTAGLIGSSSPFLYALPVSALAPSDVQVASCFATTTGGFRTFYRGLAQQSVSLPGLTQIPRLDTTISAYPAALVNREAGYPDLVAVTYSYSSASTPGHSNHISITVATSRAFQGANATEWRLQAPPTLPTTGFGSTVARPYSVFTTFAAGAVGPYLGGKGTDGSVVKWTSTAGPTVAAP